MIFYYINSCYLDILELQNNNHNYKEKAQTLNYNLDEIISNLLQKNIDLKKNRFFQDYIKLIERLDMNLKNSLGYQLLRKELKLIYYTILIIYSYEEFFQKEGLSVLLKIKMFKKCETFIRIFNKQCIIHQRLRRPLKKFEDFFSTKPVKWVIDFKDNLNIKENEEYLKKYYPITIQSNKIKQLVEYYKYHKDIPRMFFGFLADMATYFYEKKKKYEYRRIKIQLGIPYEQSSIKYEKLNEDIQVLNSITKISEKSAKSLLRQIIKFQKDDDYINIDETWLTMQQQIQTEKNNQKQLTKLPSQNLKLLKQLVIRNNQINKDKLKLNLPFHLINGKVLKNIRNSQKQSPELPHPSQKSSSQQHINSSQEENEFQKFMKAKIIKLSQDNKIKIQKIISNKIDQNNLNTNQAKHSSAHFITSTRSVSSEQLKTDQMRLSQIINTGGNNQSQPKLFNYITPVHKKSNSQQSLQTEFTPAKKDSKLIKIYSNNFSSKIKTQPKKTPEKLRQFYKASALTSQNSSQKNLMKNLDKLSSFQQFKIMLESPHPKQKKKLQLHNTDTIRLQTEYKQTTKRQSITLTHNKINGKIVMKKQ